MNKTKEEIEVVLGDHRLSTNDSSEQKFQVDSWEMHQPMKDGNDVPLLNDVGLIKLNRPVRFTEEVSPICLPTAAMADMSRIGWKTNVCYRMGSNILS